MQRDISVPVILLAIVACLAFTACVNNNESDLYGITECDTTGISWNNGISDIFQANCVVCHNEDLNYNGVRHDNYQSEMIVVKDGRLRGVVNHLDGYVKMPKDRGMLPYCELLLINTWLDKGAPEN